MLTGFNKSFCNRSSKPVRIHLENSIDRPEICGILLPIGNNLKEVI